MFFLKTSCHPNFSAPQKNNNQILNVYRLFPQTFGVSARTENSQKLGIFWSGQQGRDTKDPPSSVKPLEDSFWRVERWFAFFKDTPGWFPGGNLSVISRYYTKMSFFNFQPVMIFFPTWKF